VATHPLPVQALVARQRAASTPWGMCRAPGRDTAAPAALALAPAPAGAGARRRRAMAGLMVIAGALGVVRWDRGLVVALARSPGRARKGGCRAPLALARLVPARLVPARLVPARLALAPTGRGRTWQPVLGRTRLASAARGGTAPATRGRGAPATRGGTPLAAPGLAGAGPVLRRAAPASPVPAGEAENQASTPAGVWLWAHRALLPLSRLARPPGRALARSAALHPLARWPAAPLRC
jgi:hypothetical protein